MARLIPIILLACAAWVIYQVWFVNRRFTDTEKLIWTLAAIFFSFITAVIYYFTQNRRPY
jgi:magnesium-transporting ATPase (P-type)